jgi:hypothetical protein
MANVVNRNDNTYLQSVDTTQYTDPPWLINPDTSLVINEVDNIPSQYWIVPQTGDPSAIITADRVAWQRDVKTVDLENYRDEQLAGEFHYAPNGNDLTEGQLYNASSFDTTIIVDKVLAILSGVPVDAITESSKLSIRTSLSEAQSISAAELMNFHARFQRTREIVRQDYYAKVDELNALTTIEEIDAFDPYTGWRPI